jgi:hypothetical protein
MKMIIEKMISGRAGSKGLGKNGSGNDFGIPIFICFHM